MCGEIHAAWAAVARRVVTADPDALERAKGRWLDGVGLSRPPGNRNRDAKCAEGANRKRGLCPVRRTRTGRYMGNGKGWRGKPAATGATAAPTKTKADPSHRAGRGFGMTA